MTSVVLGVNGFPGLGHDAAAALVVDNVLVAAVEEERLVRTKRAPGLRPLGALREVLEIAAIDACDVELVAFPWLPSAMGVTEEETEREVLSWLEQAQLSPNPALRVGFVEHHIAHAWAGMAFIPGGVSGRRVGVLVLDGSGECTSGACYVFDGDLHRQWNLSQSSSLGIYYEAVSHYLGFQWGEEGKAMGLAAYGREVGLPVPRLEDERFGGALPLRERQRSPRSVHAGIRWQLISKFRALHGYHLSFNERADVALATQQAVAHRTLEYVKELFNDIEVLVLSGGVALNCSVNARVASLCRTRGVELVIPPPASDTGVAIGAAIAACEHPALIQPVADPFLGRNFTPDDIARELRSSGADLWPCDPEGLVGEVLDRYSVCGWFEGRSEVGPRALGKRSILARPDSERVRDRVNLLKGRESWRPLAPALTPMEFARSFPGATPSAHMLIAASVAPSASSRLSGVVHVDDTSRPQVVTFAGPYQTLLGAMGRACGSEAVICTSFNGAGEPLVYSPTDALRCARAMGLDFLAGDGWAVRLTRP